MLAGGGKISALRPVCSPIQKCAKLAVLMSLDLEWTQDPCLRCGTLIEGATYCTESCRLSEYETTLTSIHSSSPSTRTTPSSSISPAQEIVVLAKAKKELRAYNTSLVQSRTRRASD